MANFEQEEFKFPDEIDDKDVVNLDEGGKAEAEDKGFDIEVEDDTPEQDRNAVPLDKDTVKELEEDDLKDYSKKVKQRIDQMKKVWHDERRAKESASREREEAIRVAQQLLEENKKLKKAYSTGEQEYLNTVKNATELELDVAKRSYKEALETGDSDRIVEAQSKLNAAAIKSDRVNNFRPSALQEQENEVQIPQLQEKPIAPDTKTREWTEKNTWFGNKKSMTAYALGLHEELIDEYGKDFVSTDQYFNRIDNAVREAFPKYFDALEPQTQVEIEDEPQKAQPKTKPSTVVAPATRSTSSKQIKLAPRQVALARKLGLTPEQYAREFAKTGGQNG